MYFSLLSPFFIDFLITIPMHLKFDTKQDNCPVIVSVKRTPIGSFKGIFKDLSTVDLASHALSGALADVKTTENKSFDITSQLSELYLGNVLSAGQGQNPARQVIDKVGLPPIPCSNINKVCSSSMKALGIACAQIACGDSGFIAAVGAESMSNSPMLVDRRFKGPRGLDPNFSIKDSMTLDGLIDAGSGEHMGIIADDLAISMQITRIEQDDYAVRSYLLARQNTELGVFNKEIVPIRVNGRMIKQDEDVTKFDEAKLRSLNPVFRPPEMTGSVTAANASGLNDGASACIVCSKATALKNNLKIKAFITEFADNEEGNPKDYTIAPVKLINLFPEADVYEINEAFSIVALANMKLGKIAKEKVNVLGGAVAMGHPIGASGLKIVGTLINALGECDKQTGVAVLCNGGGGASGVALQLTE